MKNNSPIIKYLIDSHHFEVEKKLMKPQVMKMIFFKLAIRFLGRIRRAEESVNTRSG